MVGLGGHVVTEARLANYGRFILDPSVGVMLPFGIQRAETEPDQVKKIYEENVKGYSSLASTYDRKGNIVASAPGARGYSPTPWKQNMMIWVERVADWLKWFIPLALVAVGATPLLMRGFGRRLGG